MGTPEIRMSGRKSNIQTIPGSLTVMWIHASTFKGLQLEKYEPDPKSAYRLLPGKHGLFFLNCEELWAQFTYLLDSMGFPGGTSGKEPSCQRKRHKRHGLNPWVRQIPFKRARQPTSVFLPGKYYGQRSLAGYMGSQEPDMT